MKECSDDSKDSNGVIKARKEEKEEEFWTSELTDTLYEL